MNKLKFTTIALASLLATACGDSDFSGTYVDGSSMYRFEDGQVQVKNDYVNKALKYEYDKDKAQIKIITNEITGDHIFEINEDGTLESGMNHLKPYFEIDPKQLTKGYWVFDETLYPGTPDEIVVKMNISFSQKSDTELVSKVDGIRIMNDGKLFDKNDSGTTYQVNKNKLEKIGPERQEPYSFTQVAKDKLKLDVGDEGIILKHQSGKVKTKAPSGAKSVKDR